MVLFAFVITSTASKLYSQKSKPRLLNRFGSDILIKPDSTNIGVPGLTFNCVQKITTLTACLTSIVRVGATYYLTDLTKLTAGYAWVVSHPGDNHQFIAQPENRFWQQVQWHTNYPRLRLMQWFRLEERFRRKIKNPHELDEGYNFNFRIRYNFYMAVPISKKAFTAGSLSAILNDELHVNFGKEIIYNYFDQNRFFVGLSYQTSMANNLQLGYLNVFQQLPAGNQYRSINAVRLYFFHNIDLRKGRP